MGGSVPPLPQYAFMAWSLVKAHGQLYLLLITSTADATYSYLNSLTLPTLTASSEDILCRNINTFRVL